MKMKWIKKVVNGRRRKYFIRELVSDDNCILIVDEIIMKGLSHFYKTS